MQRVEICTDTKDLGEALARYIRFVMSSDYNTVQYNYAEGGTASEKAFRMTSLFVYDLFRTYPEGRRAEGIPAAAACIKSGKPALIVLAIHPPRGSTSVLWSPSSPDELCERIETLLAGPQQTTANELKQLQEDYASWMARPSRH